MSRVEIVADEIHEAILRATERIVADMSAEETLGVPLEMMGLEVALVLALQEYVGRGKG